MATSQESRILDTLREQIASKDIGRKNAGATGASAITRAAVLFSSRGNAGRGEIGAGARRPVRGLRARAANRIRSRREILFVRISGSGSGVSKISGAAGNQLPGLSGEELARGPSQAQYRREILHPLRGFPSQKHSGQAG